MLRQALYMVWLLTIFGCIPDGFEADSRAQIEVEPAQGGGGKIDPATIPIQVQVTVDERRRSPAILDAACGCGCERQNCDCGEGDPFVAEPPNVAERSREGVPVLIDGTGRMTWQAGGVLWWLEPGQRLAEGQTDGTGRWMYKNGRMFDTSRQRVESVDTKQADCLDGY